MRKKKKKKKKIEISGYSIAQNVRHFSGFNSGVLSGKELLYEESKPPLYWCFSELFMGYRL
jgi:hypothetical protein